MAEGSANSKNEEYYRLINAGGNHYDIGRKMTDAFTPQLHERLTSKPDAVLLDNALKSAEATFSVHPVLKDELQGISEGIAIEFESILCEISDTFAAPAPSSTVLSRHDDRILVGRNFGSRPEAYVRNMLRLDPNDAYASLGRMGGYFGGTFESIGVYGVYAGAEIVERNAEPVQGTAAYMIPRMITESSRDIDSAVAKLRSIKPMHRSIFVVADASSAYVAEWNGSSLEITRCEKFPLLVSGRRQSHPESALGSADEIKSFLSSHDAGLCAHGPEGETIYSLVVDMAQEKVEYTAGSPCSSQYATIDWPGGYG
ncbi:MAG: C45 family peptidase [Candidatus Thermoplasmatota archaeon]|nr:hypothetical protein [Candidatus Sysuiplasma jiujiangense]MCL4317829.1 C45 family peptidase [Candidatus Thermoplasmatota archaeon]MCL5254257.1 C45 family peptidase [Candidatus Thermoplasmatota archaeon]